MTAEQVITERMDERDCSIAELARKTGYEKELLRRSLRGQRKFTPWELIDVCQRLDLDLEDLAGTDGWESRQ